MAWINTGTNGWFRPWWREHLAEVSVFEEDRIGDCWINTATGDEIVLISDGGWRMQLNGEDYPSRFRLFRHHPPTGATWELTEAMLWPTSTRGHFDKEQSAGARYTGARAECRALIDEVLGARRLDECADAIRP